MESVIVRRASPNVRLGAKLDVSNSVLFMDTERQVISIAAVGDSMNPLRLAGLEQNDVLIRCDGKPLHSVHDLLAVVEGKATFMLE